MVGLRADGTGVGRGCGTGFAAVAVMLMWSLPAPLWAGEPSAADTEHAPSVEDTEAPHHPKDAVGRRIEAKMLELRERSRQAMLERLRRQHLSPADEAAWAESRTRLLPDEPIWIQSGKTRVIHLPFPVSRVSVGNPEIAGIVVLSPTTILVNAKKLPDDNNPREAHILGGTTQLGQTLTPEPRVAETTLLVWSAGDHEYETHSLFVAEFIDRQVMLEVTVAELRRTALEQHGIDVRVIQKEFISGFFMGGGNGPQVPGLTTTVPPQVNQPLLPLTLGSDRPTFAFLLPDQNITAFIEALENEGLGTIMAQPKIMAMSGQNAAFQVGGEIPIRVATGFAVNVIFKPFGTIVNFIPRVSEEGDIMLTVTPEVSAPDFSNTVDDIPSFRVRRASTSARMRSGETLVVGGLLQTVRQEDVRGVPYLKDIPVIGYVFRNSRYDQEVTELWVVVTPHLVHPTSGSFDARDVLHPPLQHEDIRTRSEPAEAARPRIPFAP